MNETHNFSADSTDWDFYGARKNLHIVNYLRKCGLNIMPLRCDGSKAPKIQWGKYQLTSVPREVQSEYFSQTSAIGVICGKTSEFLEILDFDGPHLFEPWCTEVATHLGWNFIKGLVVVKTPKGGWHVYYRCMAIEGNLKLAYSEDGRIQIETRGQGGQAVMPGSPSWTHVSGQPYRLAFGSFDAIKTIGVRQREIMLDTARSFDLKPIKPIKLDSPSNSDTDKPGRVNAGIVGTRPGDDFNERAEWSEILQPKGWTLVSEVGGVSYWQRPGKSGTGPSATTGYCQSERGNDLMRVFSSNASPLSEGDSYNKFSAYAHLYHGGDFQAAATYLAERGFGKDILAQFAEHVESLFQRFGA